MFSLRIHCPTDGGGAARRLLGSWKLGSCKLALCKAAAPLFDKVFQPMVTQ